MTKIICFLLLLPVFTTAQKVISGPWAGNVELRTAEIWVEVSSVVKKIELKYHAVSEPSKIITKKYSGSLGNEFNPLKIELNGLQMNTAYRYELWVDGKMYKTDFPTMFTTKELWQHRKPAPDFTFLAGSCAYFNELVFDRPGKPYGGDSTIFESMAKEKAAFNVWLGDNWYTREADFLSVWGLNYRASRDRSMKVIQPLMAAMPQYAIWDDHDYGPNDADKSYILKESSRNIFMKYTCNPSYGMNGEGIYTKFSYADVDFFLTDDRYFRSNDELADSINGAVNPGKTFFGAQQLEWLKNALLFSNATFKVIAVGSQVLNTFSKYECLQQYPYEYQQLMNFLNEYNINGVLFLTGDRHHSEVIVQERNGKYPLYDVTVSPLTAGVGKVTGKEGGNPQRIKNTLVEEQNYGRISVSGQKGKRVLLVQFMGLKGNEITSWQVEENELKIKK